MHWKIIYSRLSRILFKKRIIRFNWTSRTVLAAEIKISKSKARTPSFTSANIKSTINIYQTNRIGCLFLIFVRMKLVKHAKSNMQFLGWYFKKNKKFNKFEFSHVIFYAIRKRIRSTFENNKTCQYQVILSLKYFSSKTNDIAYCTT